MILASRQFLRLGVCMIAFLAAQDLHAQQAAGAPSAATVQTAGAPSPESVAVPAAARAQPGAEDTVATSAPTRPVTGLHELSPVSMFLSADVVVKAVMIGLMLASLATWTILIGKSVELGVARRRLGRALGRIEAARTVSEVPPVARHDHFLGELLEAARHELDLSGYRSSHDGIKERIASDFADHVRLETQSMRRGMGLLATIGSAAPFVGLFGTVWGIMNSFIGISKSQTTNLAVVAPGIAEALLATAIGLVAAIPAVIIYNHFSRATRSYGLLITRAAGVVTRLVSRELDLGPGAVTRAAE